MAKHNLTPLEKNIVSDNVQRVSDGAKQDYIARGAAVNKEARQMEARGAGSAEPIIDTVHDLVDGFIEHSERVEDELIRRGRAGVFAPQNAAAIAVEGIEKSAEKGVVARGDNTTNFIADKAITKVERPDPKPPADPVGGLSSQARREMLRRALRANDQGHSIG